MNDVDRVTTQVPARSEFVHVLRAVVAGVAARLGFSVDGIDDLKLAVDEACAHLLSSAEAGASLALELRTAAGGLEVSVTIEGGAGSWPPERFEDSLAWQVLTALTDDTALDAGERPGVRFRKAAEAADG